MYLGRSLEG